MMKLLKSYWYTLYLMCFGFVILGIVGSVILLAGWLIITNLPSVKKNKDKKGFKLAIALFGMIGIGLYSIIIKIFGSNILSFWISFSNEHLKNIELLVPSIRVYANVSDEDVEDINNFKNVAYIVWNTLFVTLPFLFNKIDTPFWGIKKDATKKECYIGLFFALALFIFSFAYSFIGIPAFDYLAVSYQVKYILITILTPLWGYLFASIIIKIKKEDLNV